MNSPPLCILINHCSFNFWPLSKYIVQTTCFLGVIYVLFSCQKPPTISYFDAADTLKYQILPQNNPQVSVINKEDILAITIVSLSPETNQILNFNNATNVGSSGVSSSQGGGQQALGFLVDNQGNVELPILGKINLLGLKLDQASDKIRVEVEKILKNPSVNVRFMNHRFSILGEINRPGIYNLVNDRTTLPDALAMAGDLGTYANRKSIMIVRNIGDKREMARFDLTNKDIFSSPYLYIQDGDMIYIEPLSNKALAIDKRIQILPIIISSISVLGIFLNLALR